VHRSGSWPMSLGQRAVFAVVNRKGGTSKTTTAVFLAHALHEQGRSVLLVDADPQASALSWSEAAAAVGGAGFPFPVIALPTRELYKQLPDVIGSRFEAVVIDTPPLEERAGIVVSALRLATLAVVPVAPTPIEYQRLGQVRELVEDTAAFRHSGNSVPVAVLFTRVVPRATSTQIYREQAVQDGLWCFDTTVHRLERFAQAFGDPVHDVTDTAYGQVAQELVKQEYIS
jgi:chromosome partitioning protein